MEDFAEDLTAEEETALAGLKSFQAGWRDRTAAKLCNPRRAGSIGAWLREHLLPSPVVPKWAFATGLASLAAASFLGLLFFQQRPIEDLLASAYTEQRTLELRIPKAAYAPVRLVRGSGDRSRLDRPPALLEHASDDQPHRQVVIHHENGVWECRLLGIHESTPLLNGRLPRAP